ncbi:hypothetical protein [Microbacterium sp. SORGH_AS_0888]|uniref:hypothetical protein n=1 Tax=Microbacterium sp. SORGH_AS_0888 TaxID=3041791 RepID=UPI00278A3AE9|nr:hypothetical protein [Microbacterium sp. SORGH_AS_0888]MDQ1129550.1 hypothetical protein [Microbacterium sp. SORGH_AS_0888]
MSPFGEELAGLGTQGNERQPSAVWLFKSASTWFWVVAVVGLVLIAIAWFWYGLAFSEEMTERCKAVVAGSSQARAGALLGGFPLVVTYVTVGVPLIAIGASQRSRRGAGICLALAVLLVATVFAIVVNEIVWGGQLFVMSAEHAVCGIEGL